MTVAQLFLAVLDFLLFIMLGVIFIRQWMIFRILRQTATMQAETRRMLDALKTPEGVNAYQGDGLWPTRS